MRTSLEERHRERKREREIKIILDKVKPFVRGRKTSRILEFGSGPGCQLPYLRRLGKVVASDLRHPRSGGRNFVGANFVMCDIKEPPFLSGTFDLIFSNHVLEHIEDIGKAFSELKRIGTDDCTYVFAVPTNTWLLLSLPAQLYNGARKLVFKLLKKNADPLDKPGNGKDKTGRWLFPRGHGWRKNFFDCLKSFRIESWRALFCESGFEVVGMFPLLLYAPSEFPIVPTTEFTVKRGIYSSAVYVMKKV